QEFAKAAEIYTALSKELPKDPRSIFLAGVCHRDQRKLAEARAAYEETLKRSPGFVSALEELLNLDIVEKKTADGLARINSYLTQYPDKPVLLLLKAKLLTAEKRIPEAIEIVEKSLEI